MIRVLVANGKGGCGKTTIATTMAAAFACGGLATALADADRQRLALAWLAFRPAGAAPIAGLDWHHGTGDAPPRTQRLVIDAPAGLRAGRLGDLLDAADLVVVPLQPSVLDEAGTRRFLVMLEALKPVRKGRKAVLTVANRVRPRSRALGRLETFLAEAGHPPTARLTDRVLYADLARRGLGLFDLDPARYRAVRAEWLPLLAAVEASAG
jgi:chromosome partitioning protein